VIDRQGDTMKSIVFIGTQKAGSSRDAIKAAERLGYYTILFTDKPVHLEKRLEYPDVHMMKLCDLNNTEELVKNIEKLLFKGLRIEAIASFIDPFCHTACVLAERFGLRHFTPEAVRIMEDKIESRNALEGTAYLPWYTSFSESDPPNKKEIKKKLPLIVKSPESAGSKDVYKAETQKQFDSTVAKIIAKYPGVPVLAEEYIDGPQYIVEAAVLDGVIHIVAIIGQEITYNGKFIVTGYELLHDLPDGLSDAVEDIVQLHGMKFGYCHLEMRLSAGGWKLIEINPRISGAGMNSLLQTGLGFNTVEQTLKSLLGFDASYEPVCKANAFAQYIIADRAGVLARTTGKNKASKNEGVQSVYVKPRKGASLKPPESMGDRLGYVIATGNTGLQAKENAKKAASLIRFHLADENEEQAFSGVAETVNDK